MNTVGGARSPPTVRSPRRAVRSLLRPTSWGIFARVLSVILLASILPTLLIAPVQITRLENKLSEQSRAMLVQLSLVQQRRINRELKRMESQAELIASRTQMRIRLDEFNRNRSNSAREFIALVLADALAQASATEGLWVYGVDGHLVSAVGQATLTSPDPRRLLPMRPDQPYFLQVNWPEQGDICDAAFWLSTPLLLADSAIGRLVAKLGLGEVQALLEDFPQPELIGESFILMERAGDPEDCILVGGHSVDAVPIAEHLGSPGFAELLADLPAGELINLSNAGRDLMVIALPLDYGIGQLYVKSTPGALSGLRNVILGGVQLGIILTLLMAALLSFWVARRIAAPIKALSQAVGQLQPGVAIVPMETRNWPTELAELATAVRNSNESINQNTAALRQEIGRRREVQALLHDLANTDELTGLANRRQFMEQLSATLNNQSPDLPPAELVYLDLDGFKPVNDRYGHDVGDEVLKAVADRIRHLIREDDLAARLGGDEFAVLFRYGDELADGEAVATRLEAAISQPMQFGADSIRVGCSVGRIQLSADMDVRTALNLADQAMYAVKRLKGRRRSEPV